VNQSASKSTVFNQPSTAVTEVRTTEFTDVAQRILLNSISSFGRGRILSDLSIIGTIQILPILISGIIILNLILIIS